MAKKKREEKPREYTRRQLSHFQRQKRRQRIIFIGGVSIIVAIVLIVSIGWYLNEYRPLHRTVIKVGDTEFDTAYYIDMLVYYGNSNPGQTLETLNLNFPDTIVQIELMRLEAAPLGITINDEDIKKTLEDAGQPVNDASISILRASQLETRLKDEYFGATMVPESEDQVHLLAMLVESESLALEAREKFLAGENFSTLVEQYAQNAYSKSNDGDFGWRTASMLEEELGSTIPVDYAFGAEVGALSPPLSDNESYKSAGYWLIKILNRPSDDSSTVQAIYLSSKEQALEIKARLEAGESLVGLSDAYSQYTRSKEKHGDLGIMTRTDNTTTVVTVAFDGYVFNPATELGVWSDPIADIVFSTQGGCWLVKVVEKENNRPLSDEDRSYLIDKAYAEWMNNLSLKYAAEIDKSGLTDVLTWALARASKELGLAGG